MRAPRGGLWAVLVLLAALATRPAHAYRPFDGTDAAVVDPGEFELELGPIQHLREGNRRSWVTPAFVANWGLSGDRELVLEGRMSTLRDPASRSRTSLVNSALSLKQVHRRGSLQDESGISIASECGILLPDQHADSHAGVSAPRSSRIGCRP